MSKRRCANMTDPYGKLEWVIGSPDDFWCFDYWQHKDGSVTFHAAINSETSSFIMDAMKPARVPREMAIETAKRLTEAAVEWCADNDVTHDEEGWNQDPTYFWRSVHADLTETGFAIRIPVNMVRRPINTGNYL